MRTLRKTVDIAAPVAEVFAYMDEPRRQVALTPSLTRSDLVERLPNGGARVRYTYRMFGISFSGEVEATDYVSNQRIVWSIRGDVQGTLRWYFATNADDQSSPSTQFTYAATYAVPGPSFVQRLLGPLLHRYNEREVQTVMQRLQNRIETNAG